MVSGVDRFGMAEGFTKAGCRMVFGDIIFRFGTPHSPDFPPESAVVGEHAASGHYETAVYILVPHRVQTGTGDA